MIGRAFLIPTLERRKMMAVIYFPPEKWQNAEVATKSCCQ